MMSNVRTLPIPDERRFVLDVYLEAKHKVIEAGFAGELEWQSVVNIDTINEADFLAEAGWVVLSAGLSEKVVRKIFPRVAEAFGNFDSAQYIVEARDICQIRAMQCFRNERKIRAIIDIAGHVFEAGFDAVREGVQCLGSQYLYGLPFMGPATSAHLAKNLGINVGKPDRHLMRIARCLGYDEANELCTEISRGCGDEVGVVDLVWWRFATLERNYLETICSRVMAQERIQ